MKYLRDNSDSKRSKDAVDEDPVDMVTSAIEEDADRGTVMPACILAMSLRSLVFMPTTVCPDFVFFIGSSVGCTRWIGEKGREGAWASVIVSAVFTYLRLRGVHWCERTTIKS